MSGPGAAGLCFGYISPAFIQIPWEMQELLPAGVEILATGLGVTAYRQEEYRQAQAKIEQAIAGLARSGAGAVVVIGSPMAALPGHAASTALYAHWQRQFELPIASGLAITALAVKALGSCHCYMLNALPPEVNQAVAAYLQDAGVPLAGIESQAGSGPRSASQLPRAPFLEKARAFVEAHPETDCVVLQVNGRLQALSAEFERALGLPVVNHVTAALWWALRSLGHDGSLATTGALATIPLPRPLPAARPTTRLD